MVNGCQSELVIVVSAVPLGSVLGPLLFLCTLPSFFAILENSLIVYTDISSLMVVVSSPGDRVTVAESLIRDPDRGVICPSMV